MNSLLLVSVIALSAKAPTPGLQAVRDMVGHQNAGHKLSPLGPHMSANPRPLGILGVKTIPAGKFKPADFEGMIARPGTTKPPQRYIRTSTSGHGMVGYNPTALVLYDSRTTFGWIGSIYAYQIGNLLSHFGMTVTRQTVESYKASQLSTYSCGVYVGTEYGNKLPAAFISDISTTKVPFCWTGYNLWEVAWNSAQTGWNAAFSNAYGFQFEYCDATGFPTVNYKGVTLTKQQFDPVQGDVIITNPVIATVLATSTNGTTTVPYITRGGNFWYVADNPLEYVPTSRGDDRYLAFCDILNDLTGILEPHERQAALRIEDVSAICPSATLRALADTLYAYNVPYVVCVIPDYMDPLGRVQQRNTT